MKRLLVLIFLSALVLACQKKEDSVLALADEMEREAALETPIEVESVHRYAWVDSPSGLRMRAEPILGEDNTVTVIPHEEKLEVIVLQEEKVKIAGLLDHWYRVRWNNADHSLEGWVFGAFLSFERPELVVAPAGWDSGLNGFYTCEDYDGFAPFLAIYNGEARILENFCHGFGIAEGSIIVDGSSVILDAWPITYTFEIQGEDVIILNLTEMNDYNCGGPFPGDVFYPADYDVYLESYDWGLWLGLADQSQGWGKWFGEDTIVVHTPQWEGEESDMGSMP